MAYVGTPIEVGNQFSSLVGKRFSGDASTTAFTLDVRANSALDIEVFVENVRQDPNSAYTVDGTTLTFTAAPPSGTNNIYVVHQAPTVASVSPTAGSVTASSFDNSVISGHTALAATPADTDEFLVSDAGTIKRIDFSHIKGVVRQVVQASTTTQTQVQTTSFGDTNLTGSITPTSTSSKIIVDVRGFYMIDASVSSSGRNANHRLIRTISSSDTTLQTDEHTLTMASSGSTNIGYIFQIGYQFLDSPSTTSECTYKIQISVDNTNYRANFPHDGNKATITLMEVLA